MTVAVRKVQRMCFWWWKWDEHWVTVAVTGDKSICKCLLFSSIIAQPDWIWDLRWYLFYGLLVLLFTPDQFPVHLSLSKVVRLVCSLGGLFPTMFELLDVIVFIGPFLFTSNFSTESASQGICDTHVRLSGLLSFCGLTFGFVSSQTHSCHEATVLSWCFAKF